MKSLLIFFLFLVLAGNVKAQLVIDKSLKIDEKKESVRNFITHNNFDYALISWTTSTWMRSNDYFYGLVKQSGKWYLVKISSSKYDLPNQYTLTENSKLLSKKELTSIKKELKIDSTFFHSQDELSSLPDACSYIKNGKPDGLLFIADAATYYLLNFEKNNFTSLSYYAPNSYLKKCYPYIPEFGKLKGLVNTSEGFWKVLKDFKLE